MASTTTVLKAAGACTDTSLPILYRDPAASSGTKYVFDTLDTTSWPSQGAPTLASLWKDLLGGADATFAGAAPGWGGAGGGFTCTGAAGQQINLPTSGRVANSHLPGFVSIIWVKPSQIAAIRLIAAMFDGTISNAQWLIYQDAAKVIFYANNGACTQYNNLTVGGVFQVAVGYQGDGAGNYVRSSWVNGALLGAGASHTPAGGIFQPADTAPNVAKHSTFGANSFEGSIYRTFFDDLSGGKTVAQLVADDYAAGLGRFS